MFTGIVTGMGTLRVLSQGPEGSRLEIHGSQVVGDLEVGGSISVDGVCLTVVSLAQDSFQVEVAPETLRRTTLASCREGDRVNLEPAARLSDVLGGHLVQGHVDGTAQVTSLRREGNSIVCRLAVAEEILNHLVFKGSVALNGVSLTVSQMGKGWVEVTLIPHTLERTNLGALEKGSRVNLEIDIISKYVKAHLKTLGVFMLAGCLLLSPLLGADLTLGPGSVLVYGKRSAAQENPFVVRLGRYHPDIVLEWETVTSQGTVHLYRRAVAAGHRFTLDRLFEVGVDMEAPRMMTLWLSRQVYRELLRRGWSRIRYNRLPLRMEVRGEGTYRLRVDGRQLELPMLEIEDRRHGHWVFHKSEQVPILLEYRTPHFRQYLKSVSSGPPSRLRWLRRLPPVR